MNTQYTDIIHIKKIFFKLPESEQENFLSSHFRIIGPLGYFKANRLIFSLLLNPVKFSEHKQSIIDRAKTFGVLQ